MDRSPLNNQTSTGSQLFGSRPLWQRIFLATDLFSNGPFWQNNEKDWHVQPTTVYRLAQNLTANRYSY